MSGAPLGSGTAVFDASGKAVVRLGPTVYGSRWKVDLMSVSTTSTLQTTCNVYRDSESAAASLDNTRTGNLDTSNTDIDLTAGQVILFVWTGGTPGALATVSVSGTLYTGRR